MLKLDLAAAGALFAHIGATQKLYLPIKRAGQVNFERWQSGAEVDFDALTATSAKDLFFPQVENLMSFRVDGKRIEVEAEALPTEPFVVFGVRACDARSFELLDMVFLSDPADSYYAARRAAGTVVSLGCLRPVGESCFCSAFGIDLSEPDGDARAWIHDGSLYLKAITEKGRKLLDGINAETVPDEVLDAAKAEARALISENPLSGVDPRGFDGDNMMETFESPAWKKLSQACLGCGACTFVCPTCQCYDVRDFDAAGGIKRFRCWDSCMFSDFTMMAHGNPRKTQLERFRQRFMHKLSYFPDNNGGVISCVGCGRCVARCPMHLNIAKVIRVLGGAKP